MKTVLVIMAAGIGSRFGGGIKQLAPVGLNGEIIMLIDRREKSKSLAWSSVVLAFENSKRISEEVKKPKALGDIRGVSYIYPILWRFGLIRVPEAIEKKMGKQR